MLIDDLNDGTCRIAGFVTLFEGPIDKKIKANIIKALEYCIKEYRKGKWVLGVCDIWPQGINWVQGPTKLEEKTPHQKGDYEWSQ